MEFYRIRSIQDPAFAGMHRLMQEIFPAEEVLAYELWESPLQDDGIHVYAAIDNGEVIGATEYRYFVEQRVAVTDFTIIGKPGLGIGRFLASGRQADLQRLAEQSGTRSLGMFAEIYDPYRTDFPFGGVSPMNPYVRREVLSHMGYKRLDIDYVHPSWDHEGTAVEGLDLCFLPADETLASLPSSLIVSYLTRYYDALPNKPAAWHAMMDGIRRRQDIRLYPI